MRLVTDTPRPDRMREDLGRPGHRGPTTSRGFPSGRAVDTLTFDVRRGAARRTAPGPRRSACSTFGVLRPGGTAPADSADHPGRRRARMLTERGRAPHRPNLAFTARIRGLPRKPAAARRANYSKTFGMAARRNRTSPGSRPASAARWPSPGAAPRPRGCCSSTADVRPRSRRHPRRAWPIPARSPPTTAAPSSSAPHRHSAGGQARRPRGGAAPRTPPGLQRARRHRRRPVERPRRRPRPPRPRRRRRC